MTYYEQPIKYAPEPEHPEYYKDPGLEEEKITEEAIELLQDPKTGGDLLANAMDDCWDVTIKIAGHSPRTLGELQRELLQGAHNKNIVYMQHAYLEGLAENSQYLRLIAKVSLAENLEEERVQFLLERGIA